MAMRFVLAIMAAIVITPAHAADSVRLYAAGSLRAALDEVARAFTTTSGITISPKYGASGLLKDEIAGAADAVTDVFASANMEHPRALAQAGKSGPVVLFARNQLCALVRPGLVVDSTTLLASMLDATVKLGTSTPKADPSGDYAWEVFHKAEALQPGAFVRLESKAIKLVGGPDGPQAPPGRTVYGALLADGRADIFLTYCTNALAATRENPEQRMVQLPDALKVGADYGLTVLETAPPAAYRFALFILADGQQFLAKHGFTAPNLPLRQAAR